MTASNKTKMLLMFDYDGTLVPIAPTPAEARLCESRRRLLSRLCRSKGVAVALITGRSLSDIRKLVSVPNLIMSANHGFEIRRGGKTCFPCGKGMRRNFEKLGREIDLSLGKMPGVVVEQKGFSIAVHYRLSPRKSWKGIERAVRRLSLAYRRRFGWEVTAGKRVWEVRPASRWNKGDAALWIWRRFAPSSMPAYIGDDVTDEDAFRALKGKGLTVVVGRRRKTHASYRVADVADVWRLVRVLIGICFEKPAARARRRRG